VWDGINYCVDCLAQRRQGTSTKGRFGGWMMLFASLLALYLMVHGLRLLAAQVWGAFS